MAVISSHDLEFSFILEGWSAGWDTPWLWITSDSFTHSRCTFEYIGEMIKYSNAVLLMWNQSQSPLADEANLLIYKLSSMLSCGTTPVPVSLLVQGELAISTKKKPQLLVRKKPGLTVIEVNNKGKTPRPIQWTSLGQEQAASNTGNGIPFAKLQPWWEDLRVTGRADVSNAVLFLQERNAT